MNKDKKAKSNKKKRHTGLKIFIIILVIIAMAGIWFAKKVYDLEGNWLAVILGHNEETLKNLDELQVLLMGESTGSSDTILICSYNPKTQKASMLSIPRDTFTGTNTNNAKASHKINALYMMYDDPMKTVEAVNKITGLDIKYYALIDTKALKKLVNLIGEIEFNVPRDMKYDDYSQDLHINLKAGYQKLDGDEVEQVVRYRHDNSGKTYSYEYGIEDYGRMRTQRELIVAVVKQTIQLKNIKEIRNMVDIAEKYIKTNLDFNAIKDYIPYAMNFNTENIKSEQLPGVSDKCNGIWFFIHDKDETKQIVNELFGTQVPEYSNTITEE